MELPRPNRSSLYIKCQLERKHEMKQRTASAICFARTVLIAGLLTIVAGLTAQASIIVYDIHNNKGFTATEDQAPYRSFPVSIDAVFDYDPSEKDSAKNVTNFV